MCSYKLSTFACLPDDTQWSLWGGDASVSSNMFLYYCPVYPSKRSQLRMEGYLLFMNAELLISFLWNGFFQWSVIQLVDLSFTDDSIFKDVLQFFLECVFCTRLLTTQFASSVPPQKAIRKEWTVLLLIFASTALFTGSPRTFWNPYGFSSGMLHIWGLWN